MDFELTARQKNIQWTAAEFARGEFKRDLAMELDGSGQFPESVWKKACQLGFIGISYPKEFGGLGLGLFERVLVIEAFCRVDSGIGSALSMVDLGAEIILRFGTQEQKRQLLLPLAKGEKRLSTAFAESEDERDFSSLSTVAERQNGEYLIHGKKRFVANAPLANAFLLLCKEPKEGWITLLIENGIGIEIQSMERMGLRMIPFGDLLLRGIRVPVEMRIGGQDEGIAHSDYFLHVKGLRGLAQALGVVEGAYDRALLYSKQREQFGKRLSQFQVIRHKLADMAVGIEVARWLTYRSAAELDRGKN